MLNYAKLFRSSPASLVVVDRDLTIVDVSETYLAATYTRREDLIGLSLFAAFPERPGEAEATEPATVRASLTKTFASREPIEPVTYRYDIKKPDGEFEERYWRMWNTPVFDDAGLVDYVVHNVEDVTDTVRLKLREEFERQRAVAAEEAIESERERFLRLLDELPAHIVVLRGREFIFEYANRGFLTFIRRESVAGLRHTEVWRITEQQTALLIRVLESGLPAVRIEERVVSPHDEAVSYFDIQFQPMRDHDGSVSGIFLFSVDVTQRVLAMREREASDDRLQMVARATRDAVWDWDIEMDTVWWNEGISELFGHDRESVQNLTTWWSGNIHPEDRERVLSGIRAAIDQRRTNWRDEYRFKRADGSFAIVDDRGYTISNSEGVPVRMVGAISDVTEQRSKTRTLSFLRDLTVATSGMTDPLEIISTAEALLGELFGSNRVAYGEIDATHLTISIVRDWSPCLSSVVGQFSLVDFGVALVEAFKSGNPYTVEDISVSVEPEVVERYLSLGVRSTLAVPLIKDGVLVAALGIHHGEPRRWTNHDIDLVRQVVDRLFFEIERARLESGLRHANEELENRVQVRTADLQAKNAELEGFTYSISHDMRAPLRALVSNSRILLEDEGLHVSSEGRQRLDRLVTVSMHMAQLVDDLLQYARLGTMSLHRETIDLSALARHTAEQVLAERPTCTLVIDIEPGLAATGDSRLVGMLLFNLLDNACKYARPTAKPRATLGCKLVDAERVFFVTDNGIGFEMAFVGKLFNAFERLHGSEYPGTGIGLANVKRIVERHGGRVWAEGEPGVGATFCFTLP